MKKINLQNPKRKAWILPFHCPNRKLLANIAREYLTNLKLLLQIYYYKFNIKFIITNLLLNLLYKFIITFFINLLL